MADIIETVESPGVAVESDAAASVAFLTKTILGPPYTAAGWKKFIEPEPLPPGFTRHFNVNQNNGDIVVQLTGRPPAGNIALRAGFQYTFLQSSNTIDVFNVLLDTGPVSINPAGSRVKTYGEVTVSSPGLGPVRDTFSLQSRRPTLLSVPALLLAGRTYTLKFGVVIEMVCSGGEVYTEVIAPARYAERRPLRVF